MFGKEKKARPAPRFTAGEMYSVGLGCVQVLTDGQTGVNYLIAIGDRGPVHITPLLDRDGTVLVTKE